VRSYDSRSGEGFESDAGSQNFRWQLAYAVNFRVVSAVTEAARKASVEVIMVTVFMFLWIEMMC
jgi:hypothetical protein